LCDLASRGAGREEITIAINERIVDDVLLGSGDHPINIGWGDG
jgi:hypothetical protein